MPCCPVLLSLYCIVIVFLNEINGDGDGDGPSSVHSSVVHPVVISHKLSKTDP